MTSITTKTRKIKILKISIHIPFVYVQDRNSIEFVQKMKYGRTV